jgi:amino acid adenylation domain-containing protein
MTNEFLSLRASCYSKIFWLEASRLSAEEQHHYHIYGIFHYSEQPNLSQLKAALQRLVNTNYNLRTTFVMNNDAFLLQRIQHNQMVQLEDHLAKSKAEFQQILHEAIHRPFELAKGPLCRFVLIFEKETQRTTFLPVFHHIILDGTQFDALMQQLSSYYHNRINSDMTDESEFRYLTEYLTKEKALTSRACSQFWIDKLSQYPLHINFPKKNSIVHEIKQPIQQQLFFLRQSLYADLKHFSSENNYSIFNILKSVWAILISIYANQDKLVISFPVNMRGKEYSHLKGAFVNTLFYFFERSGTFIEYLSAEKNENNFKHQWNINRLDIVSALHESHDFSVFFSQSDLFIHGPKFSVEATSGEGFVGGMGSSKLCFFYQDKENVLYYGLSGLSEWVDATLLQQMHQHFEILLSKVLAEPHVALKTLSCLSIEEYKTIAFLWNKTSIDLQQHISIHHLFEEQVEKTPNRIAIVCEETQLTYKILNEKANQLAHYLRNTYTLQPDDLVAIALERSEHLIIALLGVLKAGAAYVPINSNTAQERLRFMLEETQIKAALVHSIHQDKFAAFLNLHNILVWDSLETQELLRQQFLINPHVLANEKNLAYVMYTSGTTGIPKGVMIEHRNVISLAKNPTYLQTNDILTIAQLADITFDAATFEIYSALLNGGKLYIPKNTLNLFTAVLNFKHYLIENKINVVWLTKTLFDQIYLSLKDVFESLEYLLVGGEALNYPLIAALLASEHKPQHLINGYGPTECTTFSTMYSVTKDNIALLKNIPIGKGISGRTTYILDTHLNLLPIGVIGELYIGGTGLARGYLNQIELTSEKFIKNPFEEIPPNPSRIEYGAGSLKNGGNITNTRLYKTGDLARYLPDGNIEYIGRNDFQVKIRGYRVELGEIEYYLCQHPGINHAIVLFQNTHLIAYYVANNSLNETAILEDLSRHLPEYMLPNSLIFLEKVPLNVNGKLDKNALPQPEIKNLDDYQAPQTPIEYRLCETFAEIFNFPADRISIKANFFRLGGNSILAIQLADRLTRIFGIQVSIAEIFQAKTIEQLAQTIQITEKKKIIIPQAKKRNHYPLSFAQEQLLFIEEYEKGTTAYHIPLVMKLSENIVLQNLMSALQAIVARHEIFRTLFIQDENGQQYQAIQNEPINIKMQSCNTENEYQKKLKEEVRAPFNLQYEYPVRICLFELSSQVRYLLITMHHIVSDGWSIDIFQKELVVYYEHYHFNKPLSLPILSIQYKDFSVWQREYLSDEVLESQLSYWRARLSDYEILYLPTDKPRSEILRYEAASFNFELSPELSAHLRNFSRTNGYTLYMVLLAGFYVLLNKYSGQKDIILGTPMVNRHYESIQDLIGFFVGMLVQREKLDINQPITHLMSQIQQHLAEAQCYHDVPFEKLVRELNIARDTHRHPLFQVTFAVQNFGQKNKTFSEYFKTIDASYIQAMTSCDFGCLIDDALSTLKATFLYSSDLFEALTIQRWANHYVNILTQIISETKLLKDYQVLSFDEYRQIIYEWNRVEHFKINECSIQKLFQKQAETTPDHIAIIDANNTQLTYKELNERANQLAHYLQTRNVTIETPVGILMERSAHLIMSVLGILKAGGICVPLNNTEPDERLAHIIQDAKLSLVLVDEKRCSPFWKKWIPFKRHASIFTSIHESQIQSESIQNIVLNLQSENLAFIVYTSGSTGNPKGVMLPHRVFLRCEFWAKEVFDFSSDDRFLFKSVRAPEELLFPLFTGATLIVAPSNAEKDAVLFIDAIMKNNITVANFTPSFLEVLLDKTYLKKPIDLKHVFCAGEVLSLELQNKFFSHLTANLYNFYGLAESPYSTYWQCKPQKKVLIGKPVDTKVYILNSDYQPVPVGSVGELCISGASLAKGYLNQAALTTEKFIANPFEKIPPNSPLKKGGISSTDITQRLYKTGDLARYLPDGNIEHLGRNDFQVKIRGYRVELSEIEQYLLQYSGIKQVVVVVKNHQLIAYYVANTTLNESAIFNYLSEFLPDYMLPTILVFLEKFPLNTNGKLDRQALPQPEFKHQDDYIAPQNKIEKTICAVCAEIFNLPADAMSVKANFFRLGGNSILAMQFAHRLGRCFNIYLPVAEIFQSKSIEKLAQTIKTISSKNIIIRRARMRRDYPLSFAQERLWFIEQYEQGTTAYHMPRLVKLNKNISLEALSLALKTIVKRHTILRTIFVQNKKGHEYQVTKNEPLTIKIKRCSTLNEYHQYLQQEINQPFNLRQEYPIRVSLVETIEEFYLLITLHHIASDGWSTDIFQKELVMLYEHYQLGKPLTLPKLSIQYRDFAVWQRNFCCDTEMEKQSDYWRTRLANYEILHLATDKPRPTSLNYEGASFTFSLSQELSTQLRNFSQTHGYTLYTVLLAGFYVLLNQYSGQEDIMIGTPVANRHYESIRDLIGFFVNMLVQREQLNMHQPITYLMRQIHEHLSEAQRYQDISFEKLVQALNVERDASRHPLFQVIFAVQSFGDQENFSDYYQPVDITQLHNTTRFDVEFSIDDSQPAFQGRLVYSTSLFNESTMQQWVEHYKNILIQMVHESHKALKAYQVLSVNEYQQMIYDWNQTHQFFPQHKTIQQLFEEQVERTPHHIALVYKAIQWTYQALNEQANQLAHYLQATYTIKSDDLIALCLDRSDEMMIGILGVLKSGAAYVPMDPEYPEERIRFMLNDTQAKVAITQEIYQKIKKLSAKLSTTNPLHTTTSRDLAYVIYTSGTTGKPKGVMVEHRSVINTLFSLDKTYKLNPGEKSAAFCNYVFDVSVSEFFIPLFKGAELHILSNEVRKDSALISDYIQSYDIHYLYLPPVLLSTFPQLYYENLKGIIYAGEVCDASTGNYWSEQCQLFNYYGPTEATIYALGKQIIQGDVHLIGKPINNTVAYVLNNYLNPVPIGAIGELYIGGVGLARGYLNAPKLTAEKFIANPFEENKKLYKTGDLVRYLPDGNIEYIGRNDAQVKIRGYRIELAEIEQHLSEYPEINHAVVLVQTHKQSSAYQYLVGYYVADNPLDESAVLNYLSNHLPDYMLPTRLVFLEKLPLTINGKLDKNALPKSEWKNEENYVAPRTQTEKGICVIYAEMFQFPIETMSINANFFRLGGNSILAMQAAHRLSQTFNVHLPIAEIFRTKTIEQLAQALETITTENIIISPADSLPHYPLSFAQERLWFIEQYEQGTSAYHMPRLTKLSKDVCLESLTKAIQAIVARHEVLRTVFIQDETGTDYQSIQDSLLNIPIRISNTLEEYQQQLEKDVNLPFDLRCEYPIRVCIYQLPENNVYHLLVNMHHIASDGWSIDLFQKELIAYYEYYHLGKSLSLPTLSIQYKDFAVWQKKYLLEEEGAKGQVEYWHTRLANYDPLRLPTDKLRPSQLSYAGRTFFFYLTPELSAQLRAFAKKHNYTLYVVLLSGFYVLLHHCTGQKDIILGTPSANRHYDSLKDLMGSFVNVLAQREHLNLDQSIFILMEEIHQHLIEAQRYQDIPFEKLIQELNIARDIRFHPLFQVMFSVQSFGQKEKNFSRYFHTIDITNIHPITRFDFACFVSTNQPVFKGLISYSTTLFNESTMQHWLKHYINILTQIVNESDKPLSAYPIITPWIEKETEKEQVTGRINMYQAYALNKEIAYVEPRDDIEKHLCQIFAEIFVLPLEKIGAHADFFQLGGNSLMAMRLSYRISRWIDRDFPIIEIFRARTIEKLAQIIILPNRFQTVEDFMVPFRQEGTQQPIFMIPGGIGEDNELLLFASIATNLRFDCPVYGIRSRVLDHNWILPKTLREQAEAVFTSIKKIQPQGPYIFFGECIAGALAVELQQIAEEKGEESGIVFLLNSHSPFNKEFTLSTAPLPSKFEEYYRLLFSGKPVKLNSELHLLLSSDESTPDSVFNNWKIFFEGKSYLHSISGTHSTYLQDSPIIAAVLDEVLNKIA